MFLTHKTRQTILPTLYESLVILTVIVVGFGIVVINSKVPSQTYSYYVSITLSLAALAITSFNCGKRQQRKKNNK